VFTVINGVLLKPLPYEDPESLVGVWHSAPGIGWNDYLNQAPATYFTYRDETQAFVDIGLWDNRQASVTGLEEPERVEIMLVTDGTLTLLGVPPLLGRTFTAEDDSPGSTRTAILSHSYWQNRFAGDADILGRTLTLDGLPREIIGVMPPDIWMLRTKPAVFVPFRFDRSQLWVGDFSYQGIARLKPGVTLAQANADVARILPLVNEKFPGGEFTEPWRLGPDVHPLMNDVVDDHLGKVLWVIMGTVGIVLLIACANVANLFLVRAEGRQREMAIRTAIGASRSQVAHQFLIESVTLGIMGGAAGLGLAYVGVQAFISIVPQEMPRLPDIVIEPTVLLFATAVAVLSGLFFGLFPVLRYSSPNLVTSLKEGGRGADEGRERNRARNALVVSQVALALVLIVGSGLMIRSFVAMQNVYPGFETPEEVLTFRIAIPSAEIADREATAAAHEQILRRIQQLPGVTSAALSSSVTMDGWDSNTGIYVEAFPLSEDEAPPPRRLKWISPGYFETMGNPLLAGRDITWNDIHTMAPVVVVTETFASEYWSDPREAIGQRIRENPNRQWYDIVGVVGNVYDNGIERGPTTVVYLPTVVRGFWGSAVFTRRMMAYVIRSGRVGAPGLLEEIRQAVRSENPNLPLANIQTLEDIYNLRMLPMSREPHGAGERPCLGGHRYDAGSARGRWTHAFHVCLVVRREPRGSCNLRRRHNRSWRHRPPGELPTCKAGGASGPGGGAAGRINRRCSHKQAD
jgi:predicted permease